MEVFEQKLMNRISVAHTLLMNAGSFKNHCYGLQQLIDQYQSKPTIMCLSATKLSRDQSIEQFRLNDYKLIISIIFGKYNGVAMCFQRNKAFELT